MKQSKIFTFISCFIMVLNFLIFSFSSISMAEETPVACLNNCITICTNNQVVCLNLNPDSRLCAAANQNCVAGCNAKCAAPSAGKDSAPPPDQPR
jgi:hypothetical protein